MMKILVVASLVRLTCPISSVMVDPWVSLDEDHRVIVRRAVKTYLGHVLSVQGKVFALCASDVLVSLPCPISCVQREDVHRSCLRSILDLNFPAIKLHIVYDTTALLSRKRREQASTTQ